MVGAGWAKMDEPKQYLESAEQAERMAKAARSPAVKKVHQEIAVRWRKMAADAGQVETKWSAASPQPTV